MLRARGVCFSTSSRAIVLPELEPDMGMSNRKNSKTIDMNGYQPTPSDLPHVTRSESSSPAKRACEEIKKYTGVLEHFLGEIELQEADQERFDKLNEQNAALVQKIEDMGVWMNMIKEALRHHDDGELSSRQFANEIDAAIKGWESK